MVRAEYQQLPRLRAVAVNLGDDTDTVAAVAGGLAGCLYGMEGIPGGWLAGLRKAEDIEALCGAFVDSLEENVKR